MGERDAQEVKGAKGQRGFGFAVVRRARAFLFASLRDGVTATG
jgi:hypothetical protein